MRIRIPLLAAGVLSLALLGGCSTINKHEGTLLQTARLGCNLAGFGRGVCRMGMDYFIEKNENEMYAALGNKIVTAELNTLTPWATDSDAGEVVVREIRPTEFDGVVIYNVAYTTHKDDGTIESYQEVRMLALTNSDGTRYLWQQNITPAG